MSTRNTTHQSIRSFEAHGYGEIHCLAGQCWVTRTGDASDYLLTTGDKLVAAAKEKLVIQALSAATIETSGALVPSPSNRVGSALAGLTTVLRRLSACMLRSVQPDGDRASVRNASRHFSR